LDDTDCINSFSTLFDALSVLKGDTIGTHGQPKSPKILGETERYPEELETGEP